LPFFGAEFDLKKLPWQELDLIGLLAKVLSQMLLRVFFPVLCQWLFRSERLVVLPLVELPLVLGPLASPPPVAPLQPSVMPLALPPLAVPLLALLPLALLLLAALPLAVLLRLQE